MLRRKCFHCGSDVPEKSNYSLFFNNELKVMCCAGCLAVFNFIVCNNFGDYYLYRTEFNKKIDKKMLSENLIYDDLSCQLKFIKKKSGLDYVVLAIDEITCAACTWLIEHHIKKINGVHDIFVNLSTCRAHLKFDLNIVKLSFILDEISKIGYRAYPYLYKKNENINKIEYNKELKKLVVAGLCMSQVMMLSASLYVGEGKDLHYSYWNFIRWVNFVITTPVLLFSGLDIIKSAFRNLLLKTFGMDFTITISLILAYIASIFNLFYKSGDVYFDSICMFIFFLLIGRFLEMRARHYSSNIIYSLQELTIESANLITTNNIIKKVLSEHLKVNDLFLVRPGEIVPVDGILIEGNTDFDESALTGESASVYKTIDSIILAGTTNLCNPVLVKVIRTKHDSVINSIINILDTSFDTKPNIKILSDGMVNFFIICILFLTFIVSFVWFVVDSSNVLNIMLAMLVITCPCALSLAVPVAVTSSMTFLVRIGFLVTKDHVLNMITNITDVIFDKTGTLTSSNVILDKIKINGELDLGFVFSLARALEENSIHPIANAFLNCNLNYLKIDCSKNYLKIYHNNGIEGKLFGKLYRIGKCDFIREWVDNYIDIKLQGFYILLSNKEKILAWFKLKNSLRKNAYESIFEMRNLNINVHMLSGDSFENVYFVSKLLNICNFVSNASFNDKVMYVKNLQKKGKIVMMIGDGVNDAPALNSANISVTMGSGVDLAKIYSDSILLNNNLLNLPRIIKHCKKLKLIINQNIFWAIFYNIFGILLAALGFVSPYYAAIGMSFSSFFVVLNSLRLSK